MTDFDGMSHQQMLNWLDEASSFYVGDAARRLSAAAAKLEKIASEVKTRPGHVQWEGEAEKAFMDWADRLANSTRGLSDYSEYAATRMRDVAVAISAAQSAIPRNTSNAQAKENLEAARKFHNDPDAQSIARDARAQMAPDGADAAAIAAKEEANRQAAAAEMRRLSDAYQFSGGLMKGREAPTFPPPPQDFVPPPTDIRRGGLGGESRSTGHADAGTGDPAVRANVRPDDGRTPSVVDPVVSTRETPGASHVARPEVPADMGIDSVKTLPPSPLGPTPGPAVPPLSPRPDPGPTPPFTLPMGPPLSPPGADKVGRAGTPPVTGTRTPLGPGDRRGPGPAGPLPSMPREGVSGGRPVPPNSGRPNTGIPRGLVVGQEGGSANQRGPLGRSMGSQMGHGPMSGPGQGQSGISGGRRLATETGGVVGGRPQQPGARGARPFTPGGSGLVRGNGQGGQTGSNRGPAAMGRGGSMPGATSAGARRRDENDRERPDYLVEDEETWQQGGRRAAPPVID